MVERVGNGSGWDEERWFKGPGTESEIYGKRVCCLGTTTGVKIKGIGI